MSRKKHPLGESESEARLQSFGTTSGCGGNGRDDLTGLAEPSRHRRRQSLGWLKDKEKARHFISPPRCSPAWSDVPDQNASPNDHSSSSPRVRGVLAHRPHETAEWINRPHALHERQIVRESQDLREPSLNPGIGHLMMVPLVRNVRLDALARDVAVRRAAAEAPAGAGPFSLD